MGGFLAADGWSKKKYLEFRNLISNSFVKSPKKTF